jgi:hypothetical protein
MSGRLDIMLSRICICSAFSAGEDYEHLEVHRRLIPSHWNVAQAMNCYSHLLI